MNKQLKAIHFSGINLDTLGGYLCGLGLLSAYSTVISSIRGCWRNGMFVLLSDTIEYKAIETYLLNSWTPPKYPGGANKAPWSDIQKRDTKNKGSSEVAAFRSTAPIADLMFLDAHLVSVRKNVFNPIFGTGGNIGKRNLAKLALGASKLLKDKLKEEWLKNTLYGHPANLPELPSTGTWFPFANKTFNSGQDGFYREGRLSPWSFLLALEGALLLQGGVGRRLSATARPYAAFPFISEAPNPLQEMDVGLKRAGVFWAPIWNTPATLPEIKALFKRGQVRIGKKAATGPHEFAAAALGLGLDAGIVEFVPYELRETTSSQVFEAMPMPRVIVRDDERSSRASELIAALTPWLDRLPYEPKDAKKKGEFAGLRGPVERAIYAVSESPDDPSWWQALLLALAQVQFRIDTDNTRGWRKRCVPLPALSPAWLDFLWPEGRPEEIEVACALASVGAVGNLPLACNVFGIKVNKDAYWFPDERPANAIWHEGNVITLLGDILYRRLIDNERWDAGWPLEGSYAVSLQVLGKFLDSALDEEKIARWVPALSLLGWRRSPRVDANMNMSRDGLFALDGLFRPLLTAGIRWGDLKQNKIVNPDITSALRLVALLRQGDINSAVDFACARYRALGMQPVQISDISCDSEQTGRLLAGLLISIRRKDVLEGRNYWTLNFTK